MGKGGRETYRKRRIQSKDKGSDESDEDYTVGEDEGFNDSEDYCSSFAGEQSEESLGEFEEEEDVEKVRKIDGSKGQRKLLGKKKNEVGKARKKRRVSYKVDDDEDYNDDEEEEDEDFAPDDVDLGKFLGRKKKEVGKARKKRRVSYKVEDDEDYNDDDDDEKFAPDAIELGKFTGRKKEVGKACKKRRVSYKVEDDEDFEDEDYNDDGDYDDDDHDDEEFAPDEIDLDNDDELVVGKNNKKVRRPSLQDKGWVTVRKRTRNSKVMKKPTRQNPTKSLGLRRKVATGNDQAFTENNPVVKESCKRSSGQRRRNFVADFDSDFMSSGPSDCEYSISEEEREQVREASKFCRGLTISLRNSSSSNRSEEGVFCQQRKRPERKGKEKVEELKTEAGKQVCGICFSEEEKLTVRGTLNCCSHYFCFGCIMEWSKVESRCPLCKQRFVSISKPARSNAGFDLRTVVVPVPERDQVYQPSEEELRGYLDPYENMICTECQQGGDDAYMLLCDICDSPAHTYCIGLGREVPEGNWYCEGCRPTALGYSNPQTPNHTPVQRTANNLSVSSFPNENVRELIDLNSEYVPETPLTRGIGDFSPPRYPVRDSQAGSPVSGVWASTLLQRRRIRQIHHQLNYGTSQFGGTTNEMSATSSGNTILGSQIEWGRETAFQHGMTPESFPSQQTISQGRLQHNFTPSVQSMDLSWARSSHSRNHLTTGQTSTSADGPVNRMLQAGLAGFGTGMNSRLGYEHLHPCSSSRSSIADDSMSQHGYREATLPSRTLRGTLRTPF